ncbi:putative uridine kinase [Erysiphe neolycopersici]|uniref:Putative uridine kinase n=1 Tax=Erysiphe neolycopersici TaxID=212602 RepID=A0A420HW15_9PEZI|nr:putative uridine kinase [Erysiphe neolycopersici]
MKRVHHSSDLWQYLKSYEQRASVLLHKFHFQVKMDEQVDRLIKKLQGLYIKTPPHQRLMIAISGIPGSGKSTLAKVIVTRINLLYPSNTEKVAVCVPMDGFHFTRAQLDAFPNPQIAHFRRGAPFTFDSQSLFLLVKALRQPLSSTTPTICAPSFSHIGKDPIKDDITIKPVARILIFEGNYLSLDAKRWRDVADLFDERWFLKIDFEVAESRLISRHLAAGIVKSRDDARKRVLENDLVNGKEISENQYRVDELITTKDTKDWENII